MTSPSRAPFKFLDPYTRADRDLFFGRDREIDELYARLLASGLLLVYGVSGCGKTSLVQCGLADRFEAADCLPLTVRRGPNILTSLDAELARPALTPFAPGATLAQRVRSLYLDHFKPLHLIFDQLEEVFIFGDREERQAFGQALQELSTLAPDVRLIFVVREEYLAALTEFEPFLPALFRHRVRIERMDRYLAQEAIEGPCCRCGIPLEPGLAEAVLNRLAPAAATVELTWLQVVMDRLYRQAAERDPAAPALTQAGLAALGPLDNVLGRFLEEQLSALPQPQAGEAVLKALVSGDGTRRPLTQEAITAAATVRVLNLDGGALQILIQALVAARILGDRDDHGQYELRHDSLARQVWERMTARERDLLEIRQTLEIRYRDYRRRGLLLDADTLNYLAPYEDSLFLPSEQAAFVKASRTAAERRRRRRLVWAFSLLTLVLLVVSGLGVFGYLKSVQAEQKTIEAERKERDARHNLGFMFTEKAERARDERRFNEARVYALHALANFDLGRAGPERATSLILNNPAYPVAFSSLVGSHHDGPVPTVAFSPDGRTLASASDDNTIRLWDLATGKDRTVLAGHTDSVKSVAFSPDGRILALVSRDKTIRLWDPDTGKERAVLTGHTDQVISVAFSPDGRTLASGSRDKTIRLWDPDTGKERAVLTGHTDRVISVAFSPDGWTLASGAEDKTIRLWDLATGQERAVLAGHTDWVESVAFSPDGRTLASGSEDNTIRLWDTATGKERAVLAGHTSWVESVAFSPDGRTLASGSGDQTIRLWDPATGQERAVLTGHTDWVESVAFSPDGRTLASSGSRDNTIRLWDQVTGKERAVLAGDRDNVTSVAFSPDGRILASSGSRDNTIRLWDQATGKERTVLSGYTDMVISVAFSPDGRTLASGSVEDGIISLWDLANSQERAVLTGHTSTVGNVAFSPDGRTLASGSDDTTVRLWNSETGKMRAVLAGHTDNVTSVAFSPDGRTLASASDDKTIRLWDMATGQERAVLTGHTSTVGSVAFSPDGRTLASASDDKTIRLWDMATGQERAVLTGHTSTVGSIAFSPDGRTLASGSWDKTIRLWDHVTSTEMAVLTGHTNWVNSLAFSPDGKTLASGSEDNTIRLWDLAFLSDPRPLDEQVKGAETQFCLRLVDLQLQPIQPDENPEGTSIQTPDWSTSNPYHWLPAADRGDSQAMLQLGIICDRADNLTRAQTWYRKALEAGAPEAKERLDFVHRQQAQQAEARQAARSTAAPAGKPE